MNADCPKTLREFIASRENELVRCIEPIHAELIELQRQLLEIKMARAALDKTKQR